MKRKPTRTSRTGRAVGQSRPAPDPVRRPTRRPPTRRRRSGSRKLYYLMLLVFIFAAGAALSMTVFFQIEGIEVVGFDRYNRDHIIEVSGIEPGDNLLRLNVSQIEQDIIYAFPYIASVHVRRRFPPRVELVVAEYDPEIVISENGELALITLQGKILDRGQRVTPPEGIPVVSGLRLESYRPGQILSSPDNPHNRERIVMLRYLFDAAQSVDFLPITNVDVSDRLNMRILHEDRLVLELGSEADLEYKLTFLHHVIENYVEPETQARLDISNARNRRLIRRDGTVVNGEFIPDEIFAPGALIVVDAAPADTYPTEEYDSP